MRVLLRGDVQGVGRRGDIVSVSDGFARNYLLPTGQALKATAGMQGQATAMRRSRDLGMVRDEDAARTAAGVLENAAVTIAARAGSTGRLFGSVNSSDIAQAIQEQKGVAIEVDSIQLEEPIKSVGPVEVPIHLFAEIKATVTVEVTAAD